MKRETITISVTPQVAMQYRAASEEVRRKMDLLVNFQFSEFLKSSDSLETVVNAMSQEAASTGLTPEILDSILL